MRALMALLLIVCLGTSAHASAIPSEWQGAAQAVVSELERDMPLAAKPWSHELTQGWNLARAWRQRNNGNVEITLAEYLTFVVLCRQGCADNTIDGQPYTAIAQQVKSLRLQQGSPTASQGAPTIGFACSPIRRALRARMPTCGRRTSMSRRPTSPPAISTRWTG